ncbi:MAG: NAD(P)/FAD-dependent oxidoreductase [Bdellovibrionaceae bacterium]|nr:NAD(P)/FAD-dependent oxidoreductase [Pseudobdellovibrionaceae bacterium]
MAKLIKDLKVPLGEDLTEKLQWLEPNYGSHRILRKSVDARGDKKPHFVYTLEVFDKGEPPPVDHHAVEKKVSSPTFRPIVIGAGPAGLFAALRLCERGFKPILFERGSQCEKRILAINKFWRYGVLNTEDNVCFGEGGAGLYSDGKLITRIKSPHIPYVMDRLVQFGAPDEIKYLANPHVGSDKIRRVIPVMREHLKELGCTIHFNARITKLLYEGDKVTGVELLNGETYTSDAVVLATGHSANDFFDHLHESGVKLEGKSFALGLRVEHTQEFVNKTQYGKFHNNQELGAANYKLTYHDKDSDVGVYSFCMCPGGYVLSSGTEADGVVSNGMSNYHRNSKYANAAIVVSIDHGKLFGNDVFGGMKLRREIEQNAFSMVKSQGGTRQMPSQDVMSFMSEKKSALTNTSSPSGVVPSRLDQLFPQKIYMRLVKAFEHFDQLMPGFLSSQAQLHGVETRTSCPIRVPRHDDTLESLSHKNLYPVGEGAGYAGGITSAACDGVRVADAISDRIQ